MKNKTTNTELTGMEYEPMLGEVNIIYLDSFISKQSISLLELERILPNATYKRIVKNIIKENNYMNITNFSRQNGYSKQFISKVINGDIKNTLKFKIEVIKDGITTFVRKV